MKIEIELTEEQAKQLADVKPEIIGSQYFVIPAQIKIPNWDNSISKPVVKARLMKGDDAMRITEFINDLCREIKERDNESLQKDIDL